ncbi:UvrD-helicase domain-containing protein [uncultured Enterococcus sp.]|uniref:UvrD-helicase domain-containing protein n=1 Tax=uncultured Enterococcus sp. TaxID=167972 RepID=UPI0028EE52F1|nr:UvrD-helicase domain-containing protein [uncultured Enterococcus sp.]
MVGKIVLARAGSGKTYYIANDFEEGKSILLLTFTNQNVENIREELRVRFQGNIPHNINIVTYSSFVYSWLLRPVEKCLTFTNVKSSGVDISTKPVESSYPSNPFYVKDTELGHYINENNNRYYSSRMTKLIMKQKKSIWEIIENRLEILVDTIYVDEFQDFKGTDYELLMLLMKSKKIDVVSVGDFYQHSVAMSSERRGLPFKKGKRYLSEEEFLDVLPKSVKLDEQSLIFSRRVPQKICDFIQKKLSINIDSISETEGTLSIITNVEEVVCLLNDETCVKLVYMNSRKVSFKPVINWSYSKGDTYSRVLVVLTDNLDKFIQEDFNCSSLSQKSINELYVALTRSNDELYICRKDVFNKAYE